MDVAQMCSQCGWAFDTEALGANTCKKCKSAILVTSIAYLEKFDQPAIRKYVEQYERMLDENPKSRDALLALGVCDLKLGLCEDAAEFFEQLTKTHRSDPSGYYYRAICLFRGRRPRCVSLDVVRQAERLVEKAVALDPANGRNDWLLAAIRHDYYVVNGMSVPSPNPDELLESASRKHVDKLEIEQALRLLKMQDNPLWGRACS